MRTKIQLNLMKAAEVPVLRSVLAFLNGWVFPPVYAALAFICSLTGLEIAFYALTMAVVLLICLFGKDTKAIIVPLVLIVYSTSWRYTPQPPENSAFFLDHAVLSSIIVMAAIAVIAMLGRLIVFRPQQGFCKAPAYLKGGLVALCAAFLCNGIFSSQYIVKDFLFGTLIAASFIAVYFFIFNTYSGDRTTGMYFAYTVTLATAVIFLQILYALLFRDVIVDGSIDKDLMIAGWGMSNNFGGMLAMFLPAPLYLAYRLKRGWLLYLYSFVLIAAIACTLSRSALLTGLVVLVIGSIILCIAKSPRRIFFRIVAGGIIVCGIACCILFYDRIKDIFAVLFERGWSDSNRFAIWLFGLRNLLSAPLFGTGFYIEFYEDFGFDIANWVFPDMYHNVLVQIGASCGIVGLLAYVYHLAQICNLLIRRANAERILYFMIFLAISGASLLDNHLFHVFPALVYSLALVLWEKDVVPARLLPLGQNRRALQKIRYRFCT